MTATTDNYCKTKPKCPHCLVTQWEIDAHIRLGGNNRWYIACGCDHHGDHKGCDASCQDEGCVGDGVNLICDHSHGSI